MPEIRDLTYVRFEIEDLDKQAQFLTDFGFEVSRKGVNDGQGIGVNASLGDNMFIAADKRTQETLDLHTNTLVSSLGIINESLQRLEKKTTQKLDNINTTTADTANKVQKAISEG